MHSPYPRSRILSQSTGLNLDLGSASPSASASASASTSPSASPFPKAFSRVRSSPRPGRLLSRRFERTSGEVSPVSSSGEEGDSESEGSISESPEYPDSIGEGRRSRSRSTTSGTRASTPYTFGTSTSGYPTDTDGDSDSHDRRRRRSRHHSASYLTPGLTTGTGDAGSSSSRPTSTFGTMLSEEGHEEEEVGREQGLQGMEGGRKGLEVHLTGNGSAEDVEADEPTGLYIARKGSGGRQGGYKPTSAGMGKISSGSPETSMMMSLPRQSFSGGQRPMGITGFGRSGGIPTTQGNSFGGVNSAGPVLMSGTANDLYPTGTLGAATGLGGGVFSGPSTTIASAQSSPGPVGLAMGTSNSGFGYGLGGGLRGFAQAQAAEASGSGSGSGSGTITGAGKMAAAAQRAREKAVNKSGGGGATVAPGAVMSKDDNSSSGGDRATKRRPLPPSQLPGRTPPTDDDHPLSERSLSRRGYKSHIIFNHIFHLESRWSSLRELGQGAYGLVISAQDSLSGEAIAIKMLTRVFDKVILARRCLREVTLLRHLNGHENITGLIDLDVVVDDFNEIYMFMEPMEADLHQIIRSGQQLTNSHITYFLYQLLRGMKYVHSANVIHRDLKPGNLLVNADCELKICDFGLARGFVPDPTEWDPNSMGPGGPLTEYVATRWYRAPEIMLSYKRYGTAIDVWSIGCILAELLTAKPLFKGKDYIDQLNLILELLGTPDEKTLTSIGSERACAYIRSLPHSNPIPLTTVFPKSEPLALDLLSKLLVFDPAKRITVVEALKHPYLAAYHDETDEPDCPFVFDKWEEVENVQSIEEFRIAIGREVEAFRQEVRAVDEWQTDEEGDRAGGTGGETSASEGEESSRSPLVRGSAGLPPAGMGEAAQEILMDRIEGSARTSATSTLRMGPGTPKSATSEESFSNSAPIITRGRRGSSASGVLGDPFKRRSGSSFGLSSMVGMTPLNSEAAFTGTDVTTMGPGTGMIRNPSRSSFSSEFGGSRLKSRQTSTSSAGRPLVRALSQLSVIDLPSHAGVYPHGLSTDQPPPMSVSPADAPPSEAPLTFGTKGKLSRLPSAQEELPKA